MRYYNIVITNAKTGKLMPSPSLQSLNLPATYTSLINGKTLPNAMDIELDIPQGLGHQPDNDSGAWLRVWGVGLADISQANNLVGNNISISVGQYPGLPLATAAYTAKQSGVVLSGTILQAFGNWIGTEMTLEMVITGGPDGGIGIPSVPRNYAFSWPKGQPLSAAVQTTLKAALPTATIAPITIKPTLISNGNAQAGHYTTFTSFAKAINDLTNGFGNNPKYLGVYISYDTATNTFYVDDDTQTPTPKQILFQDLIGQPTWIESPTLQFKCPMRGDLIPGDYITLPKGTLLTTTQDSYPRLPVTFNGTARIDRIEHFGHFRQPDGDSWCTVFNVIPTQGTATTGSP